MKNLKTFETEEQYTSFKNSDNAIYPHICYTEDTDKIWVEKYGKTIFYLDDVEMEFEEGMTWEQFVNSEYNNPEKYIEEWQTIKVDSYYDATTDSRFDCINVSDDYSQEYDYAFVSLDNDIVSKNDIIQKNGKYWARKPQNNITFTIDVPYYDCTTPSGNLDINTRENHIYYANKDMTWEQWCRQSYNGEGCCSYNNFNTFDGNVSCDLTPGLWCIGGGNYVEFIIQKNGVNVLPTDKIIEGETYYLYNNYY